MVFSAPVSINKVAFIMLRFMTFLAFSSWHDERAIVGLANAVVVPQQFGGKEIADDEYLWFVAIRNAESTFRCSASLIAPRFIMTASHCVESFTSVEVEIGYLCR